MGFTDGVCRIIGRQARKPSGWFGKMLFGHMAARGHKPLTRWAIRLMGIQPGDHILDVGCGGGMAIQLIAEIAAEGFVAGIDYSEEMVEQARKRNAAAVQAGRVEIKHGNVAALPYDDESFDKVITVESFYFWPDPVASLREVRRVLKPGGLLALAMEGSKEASNRQKMAAMAARMEFPIFSGAEMEAMLTAAGFSQARFEAAPEKAAGWLCAQGVK